MPRPVQAPQVRREPRRRRNVTFSRAWLLGGGGAVAAIVIAVVLATVLGGGGSSEALAAAGCSQETFSEQGRNHVTELEEGFEYNSTPATSGPHNPEPALWGIYDRSVEEIRAVHNLEHGGIVVQYGEDVPEGTAQAIRDWYAGGDRRGILVAPMPELGAGIALTAWTKLATCTTFSAAAADEFVDLHRGKGPERFPLEAMQPGQ